ncbi:Transmembrane emp24 domain-containing protein 10 [Rhynchospora pubera]|uniref:Transmembrane emp24 domain-containing protein 10 n=1 Tax=Rhynchospora pubera TaxID=906938 RepID=A0AAV8G9U3_9POAL|nr:Transmembrane emp24 domain-containing protein 10 [Rhynchospora pubera]KAJ4800965.1 Transmembrane emp24 domain-containing protein 10 [Rhynchospora pubera]KAJ4812614.1 Transmembrane emp24 domain-containing protein 10 [Rhynchospora pubera]
MMQSKMTFLHRNVASPVVILLALWQWTAEVGAIWMELPPKGTKCLSEEIQSNVVLFGNYTLFSSDIRYPSTMSVKVTSPYGNTIHSKEKVSEGQFALTTKEPGSYLVCFLIDSKKGTGGNVNLEWKIGIAARDWDMIARMEKLEGVELELRKLEIAVAAIRENLVHLRNREMEVRNISEKTNARVAWLSLTSLLVCISVSAVQVWHIENFFKKKKLL